MKSHQTPTIWFASEPTRRHKTQQHSLAAFKCLQSRVPVPMTPGTRTGLGCRGCGGRRPGEAGRDRGQRPRPGDTGCPDRGWASEAEAGRARGQSSLRATWPGPRPPALSSPSRIVSRGRWWRPPTLRPPAQCCHSSYLWVNVWTSRSRGRGHCCCSGQARSAPVFA